MNYILELDAVIIVLESGEILSFNFGTEKLEIVGIIENGVLDASWSPGQDKLVIHTMLPSIVILSTAMELL